MAAFYMMFSKRQRETTSKRKLRQDIGILAEFPNGILAKCNILEKYFMLWQGQQPALYGQDKRSLINSQGREGLADGFTKAYQVKRLVWFEVHGDIMAAIAREKTAQEVEARMESRANPKEQSCVARLI